MASDRHTSRPGMPTSGGNPQRRSSASTHGAPAAFSGLRILIADDHVLFAEALRAVLTALPGVEIVGHARNGREAVELTGRLEPDLVLIDLEMPVMDGLEAIRRIRATSAVPILMLTSSESPSAVVEARSVGATGFLRKDAVPEQLLDRVNSVGVGA
jgi:two-component system, NarL family, nitrate/nitrite response regulator NarL